MLPQDPIMLVSFLNLKLRDNYSSLRDLCEDIDEDEASIISKLKNSGFVYNEDTNQFIQE